MHGRHFGGRTAADRGSASEERGLRLSNQVHARDDGIFLPGAIRCDDDRADPGGGDGRSQGDWGPGFRGGGCDCARQWRASGAGSEHAAGADGDEFVAEGGGGGGGSVVPVLSAEGGGGVWR